MLAIGVVLAVLAATAAEGQASAPVHIVTVDAPIDRGLVPHVQRAVAAAEETDAAALIIHLDAAGGRLDAAALVHDELLTAEVPTVALVADRATGPATLPALATGALHVAPDALLGAAEPTDPGTGAAGTDDEGVVAAVVDRLGASAEARDRDPRVAVATADVGAVLDTEVDDTTVLQLDAAAVERFGYRDGDADSVETLLVDLELQDAPRVDHERRVSERLVPALTTPAVATALITLGLVLLLGEVLVGAFGLASATGVGLLSAFFYGHLIAGLAGWEDVLVVLVGLGLIAVEVVVPGFGVPGILGLATVLGGSWSAMVGRELELLTTGQLVSTGATILIAFIAITVGLVVLLTLLSKRNQGGASQGSRATSGWLRWFGDGDVLAEDDDPPAAPAPGAPGETSGPPMPPGAPLSAAASAAAHQGAIGTALSDLRPAGVADFDGYRVDVVTLGDYLDAGERVEVVRAERYRRVVRRARS